MYPFFDLSDHSVLMSPHKRQFSEIEDSTLAMHSIQSDNLVDNNKILRESGSSHEFTHSGSNHTEVMNQEPQLPGIALICSPFSSKTT